MNTNKRIAIVGAGPAGITCAQELKDQGFHNITVFGKFEEAQCRTLHIDGVVVDVGTCYVHTGYWNTVKPLVKRFGFHFNYLSGPDLVNKKLEKKVVSSREKLQTLLGLLRFVGLSLRYLFSYRTNRSRAYGVSMQAYLSARGLEAFSRSFVLGPGGIAQGYGFLEDVTAYGAFRWFRPSIFITPIASKFRRGTAMVREGYGTLFKKMLSGMDYQSEKIISIQAKSGQDNAANSVEIKTASGEVRHFDHVVVACRLDRVISPVSALFQEDTIRATRFFSFLWTSTEKPWFEDRVYFVDHIDAKARNKILTYRNYGQTTSGEYIYWGAGYTTSEIDEMELRTMLENQIEQECKTPISEVPFFYVFDYNLRFSAAAIQEGKHLQIREMQGVQNVWYSGGLLSHWDIDSIVEHNRWLVAQIVRKETPKTLLNQLKLGWRDFWLRLEEI